MEFNIKLLFVLLLLTACAPATVEATAVPPTALLNTATAAPTLTVVPTGTPAPSRTPSTTPSVTPTAPTGTPTPDLRRNPATWMQWPVVPTISGAAREIYRKGLAAGSDPRAYSTIGDCQSEPQVFLGIYDTNRYWFGKDYQYLQETVDFFKGAFERQSLAVRDGLSAPSALSPLWADQKVCQPNESPVTCDLRVHKPSIVFINLGTNWRPDAAVDAYEKYLRQIVDQVIQGGALPILSTKADDVEGGQRINLATARVAYDYDIPLWNLWLAVQDLPNHGLDKDRKDVYLTVDAWDRRSFTALRVLDALRKELKPIYDASQPH